MPFPVENSPRRARTAYRKLKQTPMNKNPKSMFVLRATVTLIALTMFAAAVSAQNVSRIEKREIQRRQAGLSAGQEGRVRAQAAVAQRDYAVAHEQFRIAINFVPDGAVSGDSYSGAIEGFCDTGMK